jgi:hypothetical protein
VPNRAIKLREKEDRRRANRIRNERVAAESAAKIGRIQAETELARARAAGVGAPGATAPQLGVRKPMTQDDIIAAGDIKYAGGRNRRDPGFAAYADAKNRKFYDEQDIQKGKLRESISGHIAAGSVYDPNKNLGTGQFKDESTGRTQGFTSPREIGSMSVPDLQRLETQLAGQVGTQKGQAAEAERLMSIPETYEDEEGNVKYNPDYVIAQTRLAKMGGQQESAVLPGRPVTPQTQELPTAGEPSTAEGARLGVSDTFREATQTQAGAKAELQTPEQIMEWYNRNAAQPGFKPFLSTQAKSRLIDLKEAGVITKEILDKYIKRLER